LGVAGADLLSAPALADVAESGMSMSGLLAVLRREPRARLFLLANLQSSVGTWAATVALVVVAYERMRSPWAIALVLLADFIPAMVLGPVFGAIADRFSRRWCAIVGDLLRAAAFAGIGVVHDFWATALLALVAGVGTALFSPAVLAALPSLSAPESRSAVTSLYGATRDIGRTLGPLMAAILFPLIGAGNLLIANGVTFALSALIVARIPFGAAEPHAPAPYRQILTEAREGLAETARIPGVRVVMWASTAVIVYAAMVNVGEWILAQDIGAGKSGFATLVVINGAGVILGSLTGARGGELQELKSRYLAGMVLIGVSIVGLALAESFAGAALAFFGAGVGNGMINVYERHIFHAAVPDRLMGRAFAVLDTLGGWGFAIAFLAAGAVIDGLGIRAMFAIAGCLGIAVWAVAWLAFRNVWTSPAAQPAEAPD
jgi:MFS family permease